MGKMFSLMNKSLKTFGKAMSQVAKEYETIGDDSSIEAQSHAQVSIIKSGDCGYAFVKGTLTLRNQIILDNQSLVHTFCNPNFVSADLQEDSCNTRAMVASNQSTMLLISKDLQSLFVFCRRQ